MSYTDDRDDLSELFGIESKPKKGYSEEIQETRPAAKSPAAPQRPVAKSPAATPAKATPQKSVAPAQQRAALPEPRQSVEPQVEVKKPVKLRPPAHIAPPAAERQSPPIKKAAPIIKDEEISTYSEKAPDLSELDLDFDDLDAKTAKPLKKPQTQAPARKQAAPQQTPAAPARSVQAPAPKRAEAPSTPAPQAAAAQAVAATPQARAEPKAAAPTSDSPFADGRGKPTSEKLLLDTNGLVKIYDGRTVVNGVDINVRPGEIVGLLGPNGAGKTTSFYMIVGLVPPNGGKVLFNGEDVTNEPMYQRARLGMGYLPQEESIFRKLSVEENIMAVMETIPISKKERKARCDELLERFSITHIRKNVALTCSGGEKRRLTIARSLVTEPSLLMLDEPFSGVDPIAVNEIQTIVEDLRKSGLAILITDHNARQTLELVDRAYLIYEGKVLREGSRDFLINDPVSRELYLGDRFTM